MYLHLLAAVYYVGISPEYLSMLFAVLPIIDIIYQIFRRLSTVLPVDLTAPELWQLFDVLYVFTTVNIADVASLKIDA